jgi:hypothetical protein
VQDSLEVPEPPVMVDGVNVQTRLLEFVAADRLTVPVKPFAGVTDTVAAPAVLTVVEMVIWLAVTAKSCT